MPEIAFLMGKSSSGKDNIFKALVGDKELNLKTVIMYTTRPMRAGEKEGVEYYYVDNEKASELGGVVVTNDYNLNKVAAVRKVPVFNINELANALKPIAMPGEEMSVFVVKEGKEAGQGIGYMDDGTMIVIENGRRLVGETVDVTVTSVLQTSAGRMIFARVKQA